MSKALWCGRTREHVHACATGAHDILIGREVVIHRSDAHIGHGRDILDAGGDDALLGVQSHGSLHNAQARLFRAGGAFLLSVGAR